MTKDVSEFSALFKSQSPQLNEICAFFERLGVRHQSEEDFHYWFYRYRETVITLIHQFKTYLFGSQIPFHPFQIEDVVAFLIDPHRFNFKLNKPRQKKILYSKSHVHIRRNLINALPQPVRLACLSQKLIQKGIFSFLPGILSSKSSFGVASSQLVDIIDIGMGHSVYCLTVDSANIEKKLVIKQEELPNQSFYCRLLGELGWATFTSRYIQDESGSWEITEYLGPSNLNDYILESDHTISEAIIAQLGAQAALGDVFGRGDRHFENYMVYGGTVLPIDVSFLFWEGNEQWIRKYLCAGMAEFAILGQLSDDYRDIYSKLFFDHYLQTLIFLSQKRYELSLLIEKVYGREDGDTKRKIEYILQKLEDSHSYFNLQKSVYESAFQTYVFRLKIKESLQKIMRETPQLMEQNPYWKMYALADQNRVSSLFLLEDQPQDIQNSLTSLVN